MPYSEEIEESEYRGFAAFGFEIDEPAILENLFCPRDGLLSEACHGFQRSVGDLNVPAIAEAIVPVQQVQVQQLRGGCEGFLLVQLVEVI